MQALIAPHGGVLVDRRLTGIARAEALAESATLPRITLNPVNLCDLEMIATGALSPLTGFMTRADYEPVVERMRLANGLPWTIPVTLAVTAQQADGIAPGDRVTLCEGARPLAILNVHDRYSYDKQTEARLVYRTDDPAHPGVARLYEQGDVLLGGEIDVIDLPAAHDAFTDLRLTPAETRAIFSERGWRRIVGFQTRNPIHRAHEYIQKSALEITDGLLLHPLVGETKADDIDAALRIETYRAIVDGYYPPQRVVLGVFPAAMRYAGPREAVFHAIARKNYGCSHFIVGRDHAGVGGYYGSYDAHHIFDTFEPAELGITPLLFEHTFYCKHCGAVVSSKTCPHDSTDHVTLSGTQIREILARGELLPEEFTRPEVSRILMRGVAERDAAGTR